MIYSLYIDIPSEDLDYQRPYYGDDMPKTQRTKLQFKEHYDRLKLSHKQYAYDTNIEYELFEYDEQYKEYHKMFDVIPVTNENFFDVWDLKDGVAILNNNDDYSLRMQYRSMFNISGTSNRSPVAKYWNTKAMLFDGEHKTKTDVFNTGIIGIDKEHIEKLDYFGDFDKTIELMTRVKNDTSFYPKNIIDMFGYDNETIWAYKTKINKIKSQWLDKQWHFFYDPTDNWIPKNSKLVHCINKRFDDVWKFKSNI